MSIISEINDRIQVAAAYNDDMMMDAAIKKRDNAYAASSWIKSLIDQGYTYMIALDKNLKEVYATRGKMKKSGGFKLDTDFDVYTLEAGEEFIDEPNVFYNIQPKRREYKWIAHN